MIEFEFEFGKMLKLGKRYLAEQKLRDDMVTMLRDLEWSCIAHGEGEIDASCPVCYRFQLGEGGHTKACALGKLLERIGR